MSPREHFGVKVPITLAGHSLLIGLPTYLDLQISHCDLRTRATRW